MSVHFITAYKPQALFNAQKHVDVNLDAINWVYPFSGDPKGGLIGVAGYKKALLVNSSEGLLRELAQAGKEVAGRLPQWVVLDNVAAVEPGVRDERISYALFTFKDGSKLQTQTSANPAFWGRPAKPALKSTARTLDVT